MKDSPRLTIRGRTLVVDSTLVMGIVNASPESFSDGGRRSFDEQQASCTELIEAGADILDVGGQSAVTNQPEVGAAEEIDRVLPIVEWVSSQYPRTLLSVDTYQPAVVEAVLAAGASIINDVSGRADPDVVQACARSGSALVIMHTRARPKQRLQQSDLYADVTADVTAFLSERMQAAMALGVPPESIILDPGVDFSKTPHQTLAVLRRIDEIHALGRPVLLALSRKDFLGAILQRRPRGRDIGTFAAVAHFAAAPGTIVRVHDVAATRDVVSTIDALTGRRELDPQYVLPDELRYEPIPPDR